MDTLQRFVGNRFTNISQKKQSKRLKNDDFFSDDEHDKQPNTMAFSSPIHDFYSTTQNGSIFAENSVKSPLSEAPPRPPPPATSPLPRKPEHGSLDLNELDRKFAAQVLKQDDTRIKRMTSALKDKLPSSEKLSNQMSSLRDKFPTLTKPTLTSTEKLTNLNPFTGNKNQQKLSNSDDIEPHLFGVDECKQTSMSKFKNQARVMDVHKINMHRKKCSFEGKGLLAHDEVQLAAEAD